MFIKILIANRGEIAVRIIRTARTLGYRTVAVYSEADAGAPHVALADEAVHIGPAPVAQSYLVIDRLIDAARRSGADAVHPGYGFLSENADFARACDAAGLVFIGPPVGAIELMGSKRLSKLAMLGSGVPCIPGYEGGDQDEDFLLEKAREVGFPLMIKASMGGGGRGMRRVEANDVAQLSAHIRSARSEAQNAFGNGELILERAIDNARHIEIQVFADAQGNAVYLGERDCSVQRRHQKVVEEAPSPFVTPELRQRMGEAAVAAARACDYRGAGTVEFLVDAERNFYFLEMNTRLQVEHPVTEMVTGQDLVEWQLRVAAGLPLPLAQDQIVLRGHAVEVRLYAEDPRQGFLPQTGRILAWQVPKREDLRVDHGIGVGQEVTPYYDPMLAKIIAWGEDRDTACRRLASGLQDTVLLGVGNNRHFLERVLRHDVFLRGEATTAFLDREFADDASRAESVPALRSLALAACLLMTRGVSRSEPWSSAVPRSCQRILGFSGGEAGIALSINGAQVTASSGAETLVIELLQATGSRQEYLQDGVRRRVDFAIDGDVLYLDDGSGQHRFEDRTQAPAAVAQQAGSGEVRAAMDGLVVALLVQMGDVVAVGQVLAVMEAMKMEHPLKATLAGRVTLVSASQGEQVRTRQLLISIEAE